MKTIVSVCSARPNFVKVAAVHHALAKHPEEFRHVIIHTGQHYDPLLSDVFFEQLGIPPPKENLGIQGSESRESVIQATAEAILPVLQQINPDFVLVYGDVNGAVGAARAVEQSKKIKETAHIKLAHVEAGLRSGDLTMPEELNRIEIDRIADLLFCSEESGRKHLRKEGVKEEKIHLVGNTMIDTLIRMMPLIDAEPLPVDIEPPFAVLTLHRPSNVDNNDYRRRVVYFLGRVSKIVPIIFPIHPRFRHAIDKPDPEVTTVELLAISRPIDPLGYIQFLKLMKSAAFILTDSGGIQEEATYLHKRCFTLRRNTERPSTTDSGSNILINPENEEDRKLVLDYARNPQPPDVIVPKEWDGRAGENIVQLLMTSL